MGYIKQSIMTKIEKETREGSGFKAGKREREREKVIKRKYFVWGEGGGLNPFLMSLCC